ncbi:hypothetical protein [Halosimplex marinum]|uniref:hypothetical protein n=1 Tax=Halosimplex marinum TaxID=3396620 RepID=UPI003F55B5CC
MTEGGKSVNGVERSFRLNQPSGFMLVAEDLTQLLDAAVNGADYPMQVNVSIEIDAPEPEGECEYHGCEKDAETVVYFENLDTWNDNCAGHAGVVVQRHDDARTLGGDA